MLWPDSAEIAGGDAVDEEGADRRAIGQVAGDAGHGEVGGRHDLVHVGGLHVEQADVVASGLARQSAAADDRHRLAGGVQADAAAEEQIHLTRVADREEAGVLEEERPLLGEEQIEAIEIDLLVVDLDLGEVGVDRAVERQARRDVVLDVAAGVVVVLGVDRLDAGLRGVAEHVGNHFEVP